MNSFLNFLKMNQSYHSQQSNITQTGGAEKIITPGSGFPPLIVTIKEDKKEQKKKIEEKGYQTKIDKLKLKNILEEKQKKPFFTFDDEEES